MPVQDFGTFIVEETEQETSHSKMWNVIIHNSDIHSFIFVEMMLQEVFNKNEQDAHLLATEVHMMGLAIVATCSKERAELYKEQVAAFGSDPYMLMIGKGSDQPISCSIEPVE